jgi:hypothetical protein
VSGKVSLLIYASGLRSDKEPTINVAETDGGPEQGLALSQFHSETVSHLLASLYNSDVIFIR